MLSGVNTVFITGCIQNQVGVEEKDLVSTTLGL